MANALSGSGDVFASDNDPELVRDATPFALKTMESILVEQPRHIPLLLALTRGFTQYGYAFVEMDALRVKDEDPQAFRDMQSRALKLYIRARDYGLRALDLRRPGTAAALRATPEQAVERFGREDVPLLYWTAAAWGAAISAGSDDPALVADFPAVRSLLSRALRLDPDYDLGAVHEAMISVESVPAVMGGSAERARRHFDHVVKISGGRKAGPYVSLAQGQAVVRQDRKEFESLLNAALAIDADATPSLRLANLIAQRRARYLLLHADELFIGDESTTAKEPGR